jgi:hypothetical protein
MGPVENSNRQTSKEKKEALMTRETTNKPPAGGGVPHINVEGASDASAFRYGKLRDPFGVNWSLA